MLIVAAAELPCSLKAKIATLRLLGAGRLLLVRSSTTAKRDRNCHDCEECPHGSRPLWPTWPRHQSLGVFFSSAKHQSLSEQ